MPDRRILKDKVFLYHYVGEVDYVASYEKYTVSGCSLQHHNGVGRTQYATTPECNARLYIFDQNTTVVDSDGRKRKFIEPDKYEALTGAEKASYWTIAPNGKDYFGETDNGNLPPSGVPNYYSVIGYTRFDMGSKRMHHVEVFGK